MPNPFEFIESAKLLDELEKRFDTMVFMGVLDQTENVGHFVRRVKGDWHVCSGLAQTISQVVIQQHIDACDACDEEEED